MHQCLNQIHNIVRTFGGSPTKTSKPDAISLFTLRDILPNRSYLNARNIDFYAWLRSLDVILQALVITASSVVLQCGSTEDDITRQTAAHTYTDFWSLCTSIVDRFLLPDSGYLEASGVQTVAGETVSSHAVLLAHALMTMREMRHAIKHGHPGGVHDLDRARRPLEAPGRAPEYRSPAHMALKWLSLVRSTMNSPTRDCIKGDQKINIQC